MQAVPALLTKAVTALSGSGLGAAALGGLAASSLAPGAPKTPEQKQAPTPDDEASKRAKLRLAQKKYGDSGRIGTALTGGENNKLG